MDDELVVRLARLEERAVMRDQKLDELSDTVRSIASDVKDLTASANKGKGALWAAIGLSGLGGAGVVTAVSKLFNG